MVLQELKGSLTSFGMTRIFKESGGGKQRRFEKKSFS